MKKFFAAIVMVCLIGAFSNQAMAQGPHRDNGRPGPAPAAVHQPAPAPAHHVNAVPAPHHAKPLPPPRHAKPLPPPHHGKPLPPPPHHARPLPPPEPVPPAPRPAVDYRPDGGLYIGIGPIGIRIPL